MYFWTYWLWKTWLDKRLKSIVLEDPLTSNMVNGRKHCWNLNDSTFTIFIDPCRLKNLSYWYAKSLNYLLTHCLPITSILFLAKAIYCNIIRCNYLRNKKYCLNLFLHFLNVDSFLNISKKNMILIADVFLNLRTAKNVVR